MGSRRVVGWFSAALLVCHAGCASAPDDRATRSARADERLAAASAREVPKANDLVTQGEQRLAQNDAPGAKALFEQAIVEDGQDARAHLDLGIAHEMLGDRAAAEAAYRQAIGIQADLAEALNNLGVLLRERGDLQGATALLERAVAANPGSAAAHQNLALALEDAGARSEAVHQYAEALELEPENGMTRANLGLLLVDLGELERARSELTRAAKDVAGNRAALLAVGNGLRRAGDAKGAVTAMRAAVDAGGEPTAALLSELALAQRSADDRNGAIASLERAVTLDPTYATAHYLLGNMHAGAKRFGEAKTHYRRYLKLAPEGPQAGRARERLEMLDQLK